MACHVVVVILEISICIGGFVSDWWVGRIKSFAFSFPVRIQVQLANEKKKIGVG